MQFVGNVWDFRWTVFLSALLGLALASAYIRMATYRYAASLSVVESNSDSPLPSNMLNLASLAGVNLKTKSSKLDEYLFAMRSRDVAEQIARDQDLMRAIFVDQWNPSNRRWREPSGPARTFIKTLKKMLGVPDSAWAPPGPVEVQGFIERNVGSFADIRTEVTTVSVLDEDPKLAVRFLTNLHKAADDQVRMRTIAKAQQYVDYITRRLPMVTLAEHKIALAQVLSQQEAQMMMASANGSYAVEPLGQIVASPKPVTPKPGAALAAGTAFGLLVGVLIAVLRRNRQPSIVRL